MIKICTEAEKIREEAQVSGVRDINSRDQAPNWHGSPREGAQFREAHYKWPMRRRFPNELLKRTPRGRLRIFKLGRYFQLACIWYRQPKRTPRSHPLSLSFSLILFPSLFNRVSSPCLALGKKNPVLSNRLNSTPFSSLIAKLFSPLVFLLSFQLPSLPTRRVPFAPITRPREKSYPEGSCDR